MTDRVCVGGACLLMLAAAQGAPRASRADAPTGCSAIPAEPGSLTACTEAGCYSDLAVGSRCVRFMVRDAEGQVLWSVHDDSLGGGHLFQSSDLRTVVFLRHSPAFPDPDSNAAALVFFRDGVRVAEYSFLELIRRPRLVSHSASHFSWVRRTTLGSPLPRRFTIVTTSFVQHGFRSSDGQKLYSRDTPHWKSCDGIAYGTVQRIAEGRFLMDPAHEVKGPIPERIQFTATADVSPNDAQVVCLQRRGRHFVATATWDEVLNGVTLPEEE